MARIAYGMAFLACLVMLESSVRLTAKQTASQSPAPLPASQAASKPGDKTPSSAAPASKPKVSGFHLEDGTPVKLRLQETLSSAEAHVNDTANFDVLEQVSVNGTVVIPKGSIAWATVTEAQAKRRMGRGGKLNVNIDSVRLADGEKAALRAVKDAKGGGHVGAITGAMVATGIVFFPAAPLFLFVHGKDITIPKGTEITAFISGDTPLDLAKFTSPKFAATGPNAAPAATLRPSPATSSVQVESTPVGADISVDGKYVGSTPSTLHLGPGDHKIRVEKAGFSAWERTVTLTEGGSITVNATLTASPQVPPPTAPQQPAQQ